MTAIKRTDKNNKNTFANRHFDDNRNMIDLVPSTLMTALLLIEDGLTLKWANAHALFSAGLLLLNDSIRTIMGLRSCLKLWKSPRSTEIPNFLAVQGVVQRFPKWF
ncbi:hypothetical protein XAP412_100005 [Xanthomonas phaseoli pv. phaseoli]|uniref:Uncharacterized protein n=1 Tax=Xanthomonas campestris pv. phaseoli TaxID=317013 RepID=A0AB38DTZ6_XANCH|nr:hypothetical protein XAP412_100005 [Xanthomonas phaseoli pv. phaseoli]SON76543.1 hypothetical protein XAP7430_100033 [Xanthomonas phaseoli pv. phaseoli]SON77753.1 hypothetical protein XAP6984_140012 [Xanthomonas phaseoli pv. phaseoli]SOO27717.1 hypothetical protein XAP6164_180011 [Xanthomonas phaseoli pv. phaseoli]